MDEKYEVKLNLKSLKILFFKTSNSLVAALTVCMVSDSSIKGQTIKT
jgi:hypothetical protein